MRFIWSSLQHAILILTAALLATAQPTMPEAPQRALKTVTEFAHGYMDRLPNFTCTRTTRHLVASSVTKDWHLEATTAYELSYYERDEHYKLLSVDGVPRTKIPGKAKSEGWIEMSGNFGWILRQLFDSRVHPHFEYQGMDSLNGKSVMVFSFRVSLAESRATSTTCSSFLLFSTCKEVVYAFHGSLFIDEQSRDIVRILNVPDNLPDNYLQGPATVDYARITVAGAEYLLPVSDRIETDRGKTLFRNDSTYSEYRKFTSESILKPEAP
jgi:hypothetical protein